MKLLNSRFSLNRRSVFWLLIAMGAIASSFVGCGSETESGFEVSEDDSAVKESKPKPLVAFGD